MLWQIFTVVFFFTFTAGNLFKPYILSPDIRISFLDLSVVLFWICTLLFSFPAVVKKFRSRPHLLTAVIIFFSCGLLSLLVSGFRYGYIAIISGLSYLFRWLIYTLLAFPLASLFFRHSINRLKMFLAFSLILTGVVQYLFFPDIRPLVISNWDPHYYRVVGTLLDPGFLGFLYFAVLMSLSNSFYWILIYMAFALTYSRSSYLAFLAGATVIAKVSRNWKYLFLCLGLVFFTLLSLPRVSDGEGVKLERTNSIFSRLNNWKESLVIFSRHPLFGVGFNTYRYAKRAEGFSPSSKWLTSHADGGADSSLLFVAATTGILGLSAYIYYLTIVYRQLAFTLENKVFLYGLLFHSFFLNSLFYPFIIFWLSLLLAESMASMDYKSPLSPFGSHSRQD